MPDGSQLLAAPAPPAPVTIELDLLPGHAGRVFRHKAVAGLRRGRTRTVDTAITWHEGPGHDRPGHDGPGHDGPEQDSALLARSDAGWAVQRTVRRHGWPVGTETLAAVEPPAPDAQPRAVAALQGRTRHVALAAADGSPPLALSLLEGTIRNVTAELTCCRLRVEGGPADAARLALALGETLPLVPAQLSLAETARALGQTSVSEPAAPLIEPEGDVDAALAALFGTLSAALLLWLERLGAFGHETAIEPRAVHQARVATRRLRSALIVFAAPLGGSLAGLAAPLKALAAVLGQARDWDVFLLETGAPIAAALDGDRRIGALLADAGRAREAAHAELRRALARPGTRRLVLHLSLLASLRPWREVAAPAEMPDAPDPLAAPVRDLAPGLVERRFRKLVRVGKHLDGLDHEALHDVRKTAKKLRYALEFLTPVLPRGDTRKLLKRLSALQDQLGALNDISVGASLIGRIAPRAPAAAAGHEYASGAVAGWLAARAAASEATLGETWRAVRHTERFWRA